MSSVRGIVDGGRELVDSVRYSRHGVRIGGPGARMAGNWRVLIVSMLVVFACFFALGRAGQVGGAAHAELPSTLLATSVRAEIPAGLAGGPLLEDAVPIATRIKPKATPKPAAPSPASGTNLNASSPAPSLSAQTPSATTHSPAPAESTSGTESAPSESTPSAAAAPAPASSPRPSSGSSSGGGSFDSSE